MKAKSIFISTLLVIDTFFISYAVGFNSQPILIVDPSLPPLVQKEPETTKPKATTDTAAKKPAVKVDKTASTTQPSKPAQASKASTSTKAKTGSTKAKPMSVKPLVHQTSGG